MSKSTSEHVMNILKSLPKTPGVYQMKDKEGLVIYVGKAKSLKNRVSSYFQRTDELSVAKRQMVARIADIEWIACKTEVEALILETNLIKHLSPKYNILMKDDKDLAYIKITNSPVSELIKTRQYVRDGAEYFGPFPSGVESTIRDLRKLFHIRNCRIRFSDVGKNIQITDKAGKTIPCMDYYIGICPGPCLLKEINLTKHSENVALLRKFLRGESREVLSNLESLMKQKAKNLEFEDAKKILETIQALKLLHEKQSVRDIVHGNIDAFSMYEKYDNIYIGFMKIRGGQVVGINRQYVSSDSDIEELVSRLFAERYIDNDDIPEIILLEKALDDEFIYDFLGFKNIQIEIPKIGPKKNLLDFLNTQLADFAYRQKMITLENNTLTRAHMKNVLERLGFSSEENASIVFECYDISHTDGHFTYASRASILDGKPEKNRYKKYKIKTLQDGQIDDFASHREVMKRRTIEGIEQGNFPNLIIIDGGKGQLSSAIAGVQEGLDICKGHQYSLSNISICSIAKREEEIFLPYQKDSIIFEKGTPELMVLQKARDESHRFSINANKSARMKSMKKNILDEIPGIGIITRKKLLKTAGEIDAIKDISLEEMNKIVTKKQLQALQDHGIYPCIS